VAAKAKRMLQKQKTRQRTITKAWTGCVSSL
jgi:hypothetical protein